MSDIYNPGIQKLTSNNGSVTFVPTSGTGSTVDLSATGSGGVTSLNSETGAITLTSSGATVTITTPTSSTINLEASGGSSVSFSAITAGTNTSAAMVVGTGASIAPSGSGAITATIAPAGTLTGTTLAANVVTSSLITVGTIGTGVWQGTKIGLAYGGTNADLSGTGGASQVLKQTSAGGAITVGQIAASDLSNGTTGSGSVALATAPTFSSTITVGTASGTTGAINLKGTTSGTVTLSVADVAGTWTMKLPTSAGSNTNVLQTDGSGNTSWVAASAGTVTTTGSPSSGNLTKFSGATSVTNGDLSGDITTSGTLATTLATVNSNVGSFGSSTSIPNFTVNAKGLITAAGGNVVVAPAGTLTGATLASGVTASSLTSLGAQAQALNMNTHLINNVTDPVSAQDAATKNYVDTTLATFASKPDVDYASTSALPANTYNNGASGVGATLTGNANGPLIIDGVTILVGQVGRRVLIAGEGTSANNGWYTITQQGVVAVSPYILTRATESDQAAEIGSGYLTAVIAPNGVTVGSSNNGKLFISIAAADPFIVGTTNLTYSQVGGTYSADGTTLQLSGSTFSLKQATPATGGTGLTTLTAHAVLLGEGTSNVAFATIGTSGRLLIDQGASADPSFNAMSGDATITNSGAITVTKTSGSSFAASATTDTTNAANISSGTIPSARLGISALTLSIPGSNPANQTIYADSKAAFGYTINSIRGATTSSGSIVLAVKINGTNVTSLSAVTINSTPADTSATGANTVVAGDEVTWVFSSNSSANDLRFTMKITRT